MQSAQQRFEWLVRSFSSDLFRYAYWLCQHRAIAEDLVQETMLRAWKNIDSLQEFSAARGWLLTILRHENARRFERKQFDYSDQDPDEGSSPYASPEDELQLQQLQRYMFRLPLEYREPLVLQLLFGMSGDEIATTLSLNLNTVNTRLFRARAQLRNLLTPEPSYQGVQHG